MQSYSISLRPKSPNVSKISILGYRSEISSSKIALGGVDKASKISSGDIISSGIDIAFEILDVAGENKESLSHVKLGLDASGMGRSAIISAGTVTAMGGSSLLAAALGVGGALLLSGGIALFGFGLVRLAFGDSKADRANNGNHGGGNLGELADFGERLSSFMDRQSRDGSNSGNNDNRSDRGNHSDRAGRGEGRLGEVPDSRVDRHSSEGYSTGGGRE